MAAILDLSRKPHRNLGLRWENLSTSLHGDSLRAKEDPTSDDVNAPPKSSSDEESEAGVAGGAIVVSDSTPPRSRNCKTRSPRTRNLRERAGVSPCGEESATRNPACIRKTVFGLSNKSEKCDGSQESENRRKEVADEQDDQMEMWSSNKRAKPNRPSYGKSSQQTALQNVHLSSTKSSTSHVKPAAASMTVSGDGFKTPLFPEESPRSRRASQRSTESIQDQHQTASKKLFKRPPRVSSQKTLHHFKVVGRQNKDKDVGIKRSSASSNERCVPTNSIQLDTAALSGAMHISAEKLGIPDIQFRAPPSSKTTSSLPSTSFDDSRSSSTLSSPPPEIEIIDVSPTQKNVEYVTNAALVFAKEDSAPKCPCCNERVESLFFKEWTGGRRLTIRQQADFCKAYKKHKAENEWREQGFPHIDWHGLNERLNKFHHAIDEILQGRKSSFYRNVFEDLVKSGKDRTLRKTLMNGDELEEPTPGYYGSRGARIMYGSLGLSRFSHSG